MHGRSRLSNSANQLSLHEANATQHNRELSSRSGVNLGEGVEGGNLHSGAGHDQSAYTHSRHLFSSTGQHVEQGLSQAVGQRGMTRTQSAAEQEVSQPFGALPPFSASQYSNAPQPFRAPTQGIPQPWSCSSGGDGTQGSLLAPQHASPVFGPQSLRGSSPAQAAAHSEGSISGALASSVTHQQLQPPLQDSGTTAGLSVHSQHSHQQQHPLQDNNTAASLSGHPQHFHQQQHPLQDNSNATNLSANPQHSHQQQDSLQDSSTPCTATEISALLQHSFATGHQLQHLQHSRHTRHSSKSGSNSSRQQAGVKLSCFGDLTGKAIIAPEPDDMPSSGHVHSPHAPGPNDPPQQGQGGGAPPHAAHNTFAPLSFKASSRSNKISPLLVDAPSNTAPSPPHRLHIAPFLQAPPPPLPLARSISPTRPATRAMFNKGGSVAPLGAKVSDTYFI